MSGRKSKKSQKLASSRRSLNRKSDIDIREKENDDRLPHSGNEDCEREKNETDTLHENIPASFLLQASELAIACTDQQISSSELSPYSQSQDCKDVLAQGEVASKKRKMGSTRKNNRGFKAAEQNEKEPQCRLETGDNQMDIDITKPEYKLFENEDEKMAKDSKIYGGIDEASTMLSDMKEHQIHSEDLKTQSNSGVEEVTLQKDERKDKKDGEPISSVNYLLHISHDSNLEEVKSSECTEFITGPRNANQALERSGRERDEDRNLYEEEKDVPLTEKNKELTEEENKEVKEEIKHGLSEHVITGEEGELKDIRGEYGSINTAPVILLDAVDQNETVVYDDISKAEARVESTEQHGQSAVDDAQVYEVTFSNQQKTASFIRDIQNDFTDRPSPQEASITVEVCDSGSTENGSPRQVDGSPTCTTKEHIVETEDSLTVPVNKESTHEVLSDQIRQMPWDRNMAEDQLEHPTHRDLEKESPENTYVVVNIQNVKNAMGNETEVLKMQNKSGEVLQTVPEKNKPGVEREMNNEHISLEEPAHSPPDTKIREMKASECNEDFTAAADADDILTSVEQTETAEDNQLTEPKETISHMSSTPVQEEANIHIRAADHRQIMGSDLTFEGKRGEQDEDGEVHQEEKDVTIVNKYGTSSTTNELNKDDEIEVKEAIKLGSTEYVTTEDFFLASSKQHLHSEIFSQSTEKDLVTKLQPSPVLEYSDPKEDDRNSTEDTEMTNTELYANSQTKKKKRFGSTRRLQGEHQPGTGRKEGQWQDVETTEGREHDGEEKCSEEVTNQAATHHSFIQSHSVDSNVSLDILDQSLTTEREEGELKDVTGACGRTDTAPVIMLEQKYEFTSSNEQKTAPFITDIQNDFTDQPSPQEASMTVEVHDSGSTKQVDGSPTCTTKEHIFETEDSLTMTVIKKSTHEVLSDQIRQMPWDQNMAEDQLEQPVNRDLETESPENTCVVVNIHDVKNTVGNETEFNVAADSDDILTSVEQTEIVEDDQLTEPKEIISHMSSTPVQEEANIHIRAADHRQIMGSDLTFEGKRGEQDEDGEVHQEEKDVTIVNKYGTSSTTNELNKDDEIEVKEETKLGSTEYVTTEDFFLARSNQLLHSELFSQTTEKDLDSKLQPSAVLEYSDSKEDDRNITEDTEMTNTELYANSQTKKKKRFGSTRRLHGQHQPGTGGTEGQWQDVETTEGPEHDGEASSKQDLHSELFSQTTEKDLDSKIQPSAVLEYLDSKEDDWNITEDTEMTNTELYANSQTKKKKRFGSTRRLQEQHQPGTGGTEGQWQDVETTEGPEHDGEERCSEEVTNQAATHHSFTQSHSVDSNVSLDILDQSLTTEREEGELKDVTGACGRTDTAPVIMLEQKYEFTSSNEQKTAPFITDIQNDFTEHPSPQEASMTVEVHDSWSTKQVDGSPTCTTKEHTFETEDSLTMPVIKKSTHEVLSDQIRQMPWDQNMAEDQLEQPADRDLETESPENTCIIVNIHDVKNTVGNETELNVAADSDDILTSVEQTEIVEDDQLTEPKEIISHISSTPVQEEANIHIRAADHRQIMVSDLIFEGKSGEQDEDGEVHQEEKYVTIVNKYDLSSTPNELYKNDKIEVKEETKLGSTEYVTTDDFLLASSKQHLHSDFFSQTTEKDLVTKLQPSPVLEYSDPKEDERNRTEDTEMTNTELCAKNQTKKKKRFGSTRRLQGQHQPGTGGKEGQWQDVETTEGPEHDGEASSKQHLHSELFSQTTEKDLDSKIQPSPVLEYSDPKEDERNITEDTEMTNTELCAKNQTKKKKRFGSTRRLQGEHQPGTGGKEGQWQDVETTEGPEHDREERCSEEVTNQAATHHSFTQSHSVDSKVSLDILDQSLTTEREEGELKDVTGVIQNDFTDQPSPQEASMTVEVCDSGSTENEFPKQVDGSPTCTTKEHIFETGDSLTMPVNKESTREVLSDQIRQTPWDHNLAEKDLEQSRSRELHTEPLESTYPEMHIKVSKSTQDKVIAEKNVFEKRRKMGSTRRSLIGQFPESDKKYSIEEIKEDRNIKQETIEQFPPVIGGDVEGIPHSSLPTFTAESQSTDHQGTEKIDQKRRRMASTRKNLQRIENKKPGMERMKDIVSRDDEDISREETKSAINNAIVNTVSGFHVETTEHDDHTQMYETSDQLEDSLLSEIEYELKKGSSLNAPLEIYDNQQDTSGIPDPVSEQCQSTLQISPSLEILSQSCTDPSSPGRRRKMGSTRKTSRNKHIEETGDKNTQTEQEVENLVKSKSGENSELEKERETPKDIDMQVSGDLKGSDEDVLVPTDHLTDGKPYVISEPESLPISHSTSEHSRMKTSPSDEEGIKPFVKDVDVATEDGLVSLDDIRKSALFDGSSGERLKIDFERWNEQVPDFGVAVYNVVMVGNCNVGKTSFIKYFQSGHFSPGYNSTVGVDTFIKTITLGNRTIKLNLWDTAGQERYHSITTQVLHKAQGLLLMYDITSCQSFVSVRDWISQIQDRAPTDVIIMLLGNKNDCAEREVRLQEGEDLSREYQIHFMECSAATGENVSESMKALAWLLVNQRVRKEDEQTTLQPKQPQKKSGCC
ncbi:uncharacterized protein rab44 [Brachyhypopomus gauderio]|uniref:uncharacterized protein rab44 n=1 Tax=Brachyhypopomus gauderio TaxID=698409 RepID=UPI004041A27F